MIREDSDGVAERHSRGQDARLEGGLLEVEHQTVLRTWVATKNATG